MKRILLSCGVLLLFSSCKKFLDVSYPPDEPSAAEIFDNDASATAAILSIYNNMAGGSGYISPYSFVSGEYEVTLVCGLSADEFSNREGDRDVIQLAADQLTSDNSFTDSIWTSIYRTLYAVNSALDGLGRSTKLTASLRTDLEAEAKFVRAFCYYYATTLYGDVPLITGTDYTVNTQAKRAAQADVYALIMADLRDARAGLNMAYTDAGNALSQERVRPVRAAASALLARMYLLLGVYDSASTAASEVLNQTGVYGLCTPDSVFLKNSRETIWALQPPDGLNISTYDGLYFHSNAPFYLQSLSASLLAAFEDGDLRRYDWVAQYQGASVSDSGPYFYPDKYKEALVPSGIPSEYSILLRVAEQYLNRAEANVHLGNLEQAREDIDLLRARCSLAPTTAMSADDLLTAILHERQIEFFSEMGQRWLDLKRTGTIDQVLSAVKPGWTPDASLYPVPASQILLDQHLLPQNAGY